MIQEEKHLLLKDICARLPYGIFVKEGDVNDRVIYTYDYHPHIETCKPYLRPMSSMTDEEKEDLKKNYRFYFDDCDDGITNGIYSSQFNRTIYEMIDECDISDIIDWLNSHQFDYHWLIEKGLALEAPEGMYKI